LLPVGVALMSYTPIEAVADKYTARFMSGLMSKDWQKALNALLITAKEFHEVNALPPHQEAESVRCPDDLRILVSAALHAQDKQGA